MRILRRWHLASLDAPTVAVVWSLAFAWVGAVHLEPWIPLLLACGTWTVYVGDRLLDARRAINSGDLSGLRERHYFHWRQRAKLLPLAVCTATIAIALVMRLMPTAMREHDSLIAAAAVAYFSGVHSAARFPACLRRLASKELIVGVLFAAGCAAPALSRLRSIARSAWTEWPILACIVFFAILAWLNCTAIERWESCLKSFNIDVCTAIVSVIGFASAAALAFTHPRASALLFAGAMGAFGLFLIDRNRDKLAPLTLRALADIVLLTPAILLAFGARG